MNAMVGVESLTEQKVNLILIVHKEPKHKIKIGKKKSMNIVYKATQTLLWVDIPRIGVFSVRSYKVDE